VSTGSHTADKKRVTTLDMTDDLATGDEGTAADVAHAAGLETIARLHDEALERIAHLHETWDSPEDEVRVLHLAERPTVVQRAEAAAA
jgi:hypothetical protein